MRCREIFRGLDLLSDSLVGAATSLYRQYRPYAQGVIGLRLTRARDCSATLYARSDLRYTPARGPAPSVRLQPPFFLSGQALTRLNHNHGMVTVSGTVRTVTS